MRQDISVETKLKGQWGLAKLVSSDCSSPFGKIQIRSRSSISEEVHRYNYQQVHSTTGEIPALRFEKAQKENRSLFRPFASPKPFTSAKDVFCLRHTRTADGYRKISITGHALQIPDIEPREDLDLHLIPDETKNLVELRIWAADQLVHTTHLPLTLLQKTIRA